MRIVIVNAVNGISSTGRTCTEIANYLIDRGEDAYIAYSTGLPYSNEYVIGSSFDRKLHAFLSRVFGMQAYFSYGPTRKLLTFLDRVKPDVIDIHNLHSNFINYMMLFNYIIREKIPTVITLHDCWFFTGKCFHYTVENCYKWIEGCDNCPRVHKDNPSWFFDKTKKMWTDKRNIFTKIPKLAVVGVSDWITNEAKKSFLSSAKIIRRIYNWVDIEVFRPRFAKSIKEYYGLDSKFVILGVASRWSYAKGLDKFIELSNRLDTDFQIVLVGSHDSKVKIPSNILTIPSTNDTEKLSYYYSMADVFVTLSMEESFGKVSAEALACGTPVIAFNSTANPELIGEGCGYVVEKNNISAVIEAIKEVKSRGKSYYTQNCINFARKNFNKENGIKEYYSIFKELLLI